jgi:hypothetical protein
VENGFKREMYLTGNNYIILMGLFLEPNSLDFLGGEQL